MFGTQILIHYPFILKIVKKLCNFVNWSCVVKKYMSYPISLDSSALPSTLKRGKRGDADKEAG